MRKESIMGKTALKVVSYIAVAAVSFAIGAVAENAYMKDKIKQEADSDEDGEAAAAAK
jgi:hypothetical protein